MCTAACSNAEVFPSHLALPGSGNADFEFQARGAELPRGELKIDAQLPKKCAVLSGRECGKARWRVVAVGAVTPLHPCEPGST